MRLPGIVLTCFLLVCADAAAFAQEGKPEECRLLPPHRPDAGAAYRPGVDVHGKPVVPADLNAPPVMGSGRVIVPLSVDLKKRLENIDMKGIEMDSQLGILEIYPDGRVTYDGADLTPQIHAVCAQTPPVPLAAEAGQDAVNDIKSDAIEVAPVDAVPPGGVLIEGGEFREEGYK